MTKLRISRISPSMGYRLAKLSVLFMTRKHYVIDELHSTEAEMRHFCIGKIGDKVATVTFTIRDKKIRIISAGFYRKGRRVYEKNK